MPGSKPTLVSKNELINESDNPIFTRDTSVASLEPRFETSTTDVTINNSPSDTSIFSFSGEGAIQAIMVSFSSKQVEMVLDIDGTEVLRIDVDDLGNSGEYNLGDVSLSGPFNLRTAGSAESIIIDFGGILASFATSFEISALETSGSLNTKSHIVIYREAV